MKKCIMAILALLLLLGLCGCELDAQGQPGEDATKPKDPVYAMTVRVTFQPEFLLRLDSLQNILSAEAVNADAETLLAQTEVTGKSYAQAMTELLSKAYEGGSLQGGTQIAFGLEVADVTAPGFSDILAPVEQLEEEKEISLEPTLQLLIDPEPEKETTTVINGQKVFIHHIPVMGENGQTGISTVYTPDAVLLFDPLKNAVMEINRDVDGGRSLTYYDKGTPVKGYYTDVDGSWSFTEYQNGKQYRRETRDADGTTQKVRNYPNGQVEYSLSDYAGGAFSYQYQFENGKVAEQEFLLDGNYSHTKWAENGQILMEKSRLVDGTTMDATYDENGKTLSYARYEPNGNYRTVTLTEDGGSIEERMWEGVWEKNIRNAEELLVQQFSKGPDGWQTETRYYSNGNLAFYDYISPGGDDGTEYSHLTEHYYENGNKQSIRYETPEYITETSIREDGSTIQSVTNHTNGNQDKLTFHSNGNIATSERLQSNGDILIEIFYENGNIKTSESRTASQHRIAYFREDGTQSEQVITWPDGTVEKSFFDSNGNEISSETNTSGGGSETANRTYYENGNIKTEEARGADHLYVCHYREDGTLSHTITTFDNGTKTTTTYFPNGNEDTTETYEPNGNYSTRQYYEHGQLKLSTGRTGEKEYRYEYNPDGTHQYFRDGTEEFFFSEGKLIKAVVDGVTYTDPDRLSMFAESFGIVQ